MMDEWIDIVMLLFFSAICMSGFLGAVLVLKFYYVGQEMKFSEAMKAYEEGKKVRCKRWASHLFIEIGSWEAKALVESDVNGYWEVKESDPDLLHQRCRSCKVIEQIRELITGGK